MRTKLRGLGVRDDQIAQDDAHKSSEYGGACGDLVVRLDGCGRGQRLLFALCAEVAKVR